MRIWFPEGPTHYKEQIERLQIAVCSIKPEAEKKNLGRFSARTKKILDVLLNAERPLCPEEVAEECGITKYQARSALSGFAINPSYGIKISHSAGLVRYYTMA